MARGVFIVLEGPEGSGKSTQARRLSAALRERGYRVVETREPGGTAIGEQIRGILLAHGNYAMLASTEALLHTAARAQHVGEVITPALDAGAVVVCDRFIDSTLAYQGGGRGVPIADLLAIQGLATGGVRPDLRLLLDLPVDVGLQRRMRAGAEVNRIDRASVAFHQRVRDTYRSLAAADPEGWAVIDASGSPDEVAQFIVEAVATRTRLLVDWDEALDRPTTMKVATDG